MKSLRLLILVCVVLSSCSGNPQPSPTVASPVCTLMGCRNLFSVSFAGSQPEDYSIELAEPAGRKVILLCWNASEAADRVKKGNTISSHQYRLDDLAARSNDEISSAIGRCDSLKGYITEQSFEDGILYSAAIQCFEPKPSGQDITACAKGGGDFANFSPAEATITVSYEDNVVTRTVRPAYTTSRPNGPNCEPECRNAVETIALP